MKWLFAALLVLQAHFATSYLVPLDSEAQATFGGLLRWAWPWSIGDGGLLDRIPASGEYPISGVWLAGSAALMFILAALAESFGYGRSYPLAPAHGGLLRSHEAGADGPRRRRPVVCHN